MTSEEFHRILSSEIESIRKAIATEENQWIIKGFVDVFTNVYTITIDTKVISKVLEILLYPTFLEFAQKHNFKLELPKAQNHYPDATFISLANENEKFAVDIKSTIRKNSQSVNMMTLGAFTGYFRNRSQSKNILYPYNSYLGHFVFGVIYSQNKDASDERQYYNITEIETIPSVIYDFDFFVQPKYKIAVSTPGSGNTKNIGSCTNIDQLINGTGPFHQLGVDIFDDYWMYYLTEDMAKKDDLKRPYTNLANYFEYKRRFIDAIDFSEELLNDLSQEEENENEQ
ncbi:MAG: type II restriction endonuclease [Microcystaceae cyanobacterium]